MKNLVCLLAFWIATANAAERLAFDGNEYLLAQVSVRGTEVTNDYRIKGETEERWDTALAVQLYKGESSFQNFVEQYLNTTAPQLMDDPITMAREGAKDDLVLVLFRNSPRKGFYEYDLRRFVKTREGIMSYQFAQRFPVNSDLALILTRQSGRIEQLNRLSVAPRDKM